MFLSRLTFLDLARHFAIGRTVIDKRFRLLFMTSLQGSSLVVLRQCDTLVHVVVSSAILHMRTAGCQTCI